MSRFTSSYFDTDLFLVMNSEDYDSESESTFWDWIWTPFDPFTWEAWLLMMFVCLYMEVARNIVHERLEGKKTHGPAAEVGNASYQSIVSITSGSVAFIPEDVSTGEKIMIAGFAGKCVGRILFGLRISTPDTLLVTWQCLPSFS